MSNRRVEVDLILNARNYLDESKKVLAETKATEAALEHMGDGADRTGTDLSELAKNTDHTRESLRGLHGNAHDTGEALRLLDARIIQTKMSVRDLGVEFAHTGDAATGKQLDSERSMLGSLTRLRKEIALAHEELQKLAKLDAPFHLGEMGNGKSGIRKVIDDVMNAVGDATAAGVKIGGAIANGIGGTLSSLGPYIMPILIGALVAAAVAATPIIGAAISGAVALGVGTIGLVGGILAAIHNPAVKDALHEFTASIGEKFFSLGEVFSSPLVAALGVLKKAFWDLDLKGVFGPVAPYVTILATGIAGLAKEFLPRFGQALLAARPGLEIMARELPHVGAALGDMLKTMAESKGMTQGVLLVFNTLSSLFRQVGTSVAWLSDRFADVNAAVVTVLSTYERFAGNRVVHFFYGDLNEKVQQFIAGASVGAIVGRAYTDVVGQMKTPMQLAAEAADRLAGGLRNANDMMTDVIDKNLSFDQAIVRMEQGFRNFSDTVKQNGRHWTDNTKAAEANQQALFDQIGVLEQLRLKNIEATGDVAGANVEFDAQLQNLLGIAKAAGASKEFLDRLATTYTITINAKQVTDAIEAMARKASDIYHSFFGGGGPAPPPPPDRASKRADSRRRAAGGPVGPGAWIVGDGGRPEVLQMGAGTNGHVYPSVQSWQAAQPPPGGWRSGAGMGSAPLPPMNLTVQLVDSLTGTVMRTALITDALNRNKPASVVAAAYP